MIVTTKNFKEFISGTWDYCKKRKIHKALHIHPKEMDVGGGKISICDIDVLKKYPKVDTFTISGLNQATFEYFIKNYGSQIKAIRFFKNKLVEDWSFLSTLPNLEFIYFFHNQRITKLWDMTNNTNLKGIAISDFTRLKDLKGIEKAPNLEYFSFEDAVHNTSTVNSYMCFANTNLKYLKFLAKDIIDRDLSFLKTMPNLREFDFAPNFFPTEVVAWICSNFPQLKGSSLKPYKIFNLSINNEKKDVVFIIGKGKPAFDLINNEKRIEKYILNFENLKKKYHGKDYKEAFFNDIK